MTKAELMKQYEEAKTEGDIESISLFIHMPTGETETITNPNVAEKIAYVDKTYDENLVHANCKDIYIEDVLFLAPFSLPELMMLGEPCAHMSFAQALKVMQDGAKVKLPSWGGYWYWDAEKETVMIHTKEGKELDIRETDCVEYTLLNVSNGDWILANEENCPELGGEALFGFDEAIKYLKRGFKMKRKGWNGKTQHIELASCISYQAPDGEIVNAEHDAIGNRAIAFVGTSGVQLGWLASQADMLAEDWMFAE